MFFLEKRKNITGFLEKLKKIKGKIGMRDEN
jgi:hypothetical protein